MDEVDDEIEQLRRDPSVKRLFQIMMKDDKKDDRSEHGKNRGKINGKNNGNKAENPKSKKPIASSSPVAIKSPSDTTIYAPALNKLNNLQLKANSPLNNIPQEPRNLVDQINMNSFTSGHYDQRHADEHSRRDRSRSRSKARYDDRTEGSSHHHHHKDAERSSTMTPRRRSRHEVADQLILNAEQFKASLVDPPSSGKDNGKNNYEVLEAIKNLTESVKSLTHDEDDEFFHITCHVDANLHKKAELGEFVELEKLLPGDKLTRFNDEQTLKLVHKHGETYLAPPNREQKITGVRRWEQAFRVYAAIYSNAHPSRSAEIWQYVHVINTAAATYTWENVAYYDYTFRQLMHKNPQRNWGKTYTQLWNLALTDKIHFQRGGHHFHNHGSTNNSSGSNSSCKHGTGGIIVAGGLERGNAPNGIADMTTGVRHVVHGNMVLTIVQNQLKRITDHPILPVDLILVKIVKHQAHQLIDYTFCRE